MKAVIISSKGGPPTVINDRPLPRLRPTYLLVRTYAVALNPADVAIIDYAMGDAGCLLGCDYAGVIEAVGEGVQRDLKVGERVCGVMRAGDPLERENGCFAEWVCVKADVCWKVPEGMGWEEACTMGVMGVTTGRCLVSSVYAPFLEL